MSMHKAPRYKHPKFDKERSKGKGMLVARNTRWYGDMEKGYATLHGHRIVQWDKAHIRFSMCDWPTMTTRARLGFIAGLLGANYAVWKWRGDKHVLWDNAHKVVRPFVEGRWYARQWQDPRRVAQADKEKSREMEKEIARKQRRPKHYPQELLPPVLDWKNRKPGYMSVKLLGRRKYGSTIIQLTQHGDRDFFYEAFTPSPFPFARHNAYARLRFRNYENAVTAFNNDLVALLDPLDEPQMLESRRRLPFTDEEQ